MYRPENLRSEIKRNRNLKKVILFVSIYAVIMTAFALSFEERGNRMQKYCNDMDERNYELKVSNEKLTHQVLKLEADIVELETY